MAEKQQGKKGSKKAGRDKAKSERYRHAGKREHNKARKLFKHLHRWPNDSLATEALERLRDEKPLIVRKVAEEFAKRTAA